MALISCAAVGLVARGWMLCQETDRPPVLREGGYRVGQVLAGDALQLTNSAVVRLRGVAVPTHAASADRIAAEAARFTHSFAASRAVRLEFDPERVDDRGHFMAYVFVNDRSLNEALIRAGWACFDSRQRCMSFRSRRLLQAQQEAVDARRGIWAAGDEQLVIPSGDP